MASVQGGMNQTKTLFLGILVIGLIGLLFLVIYGNLAGNLGFSKDSGTITNNTINLTTTGATPADLAGKTDVTLTSVVLVNVNGTTVPTNQYETSGTVVSAVNASVTHIHHNVNVSASFSADSLSEQRSDQVIGNLTSGATEFFSFSNVWFILGAVALLIVIVIAIIGLVSKIGTGKGGKFSS